MNELDTDPRRSTVVARRAVWAEPEQFEGAGRPVRDFHRWSLGTLFSAINDQHSRIFLWVPVCLIAGVSAYFALPIEPDAPVFAIAAAMSAVLGWRARASRWRMCYLAVALALGGFVLANLRSAYIEAPSLAATTGPVVVAGWVSLSEMTGRSRARVVIDIDRITQIRRAAWPKKVQMTLYKLDAVPRAGSYIQISGRLYPLMTPVAPGAYDHGRTLWFKGIGATGRGVLASESERTAALPARTSWRTLVARLRATIDARIDAALPARTAAFAKALITGNRASIRSQLREQLSIAGLAHVLAISGLHMSLVAGGMFWVVRALLALFAPMALSWPIKKFAAVAALFAGAGYLVLSGASVSTQRAFIMLAVMFIAVLADRPAITLRNLAIAATLIVLISPEAVLTAGFQMSFMAVMGLIATYESLRQRRAQLTGMRRQHGPIRQILRWIFMGLMATAMTTAIASVFTGLPAAYHFNRVAPFGVIANILALPVISLLVMPLATVSALLMPLGLESMPLWLMGEGLRLVIFVAGWVSGLPNAASAVPTLPGSSVLCLGFAALWLCLWTGRLRFLSIVPAIAGVLLAFDIDRPDILIERTGKNVALRNADGNLVLAQGRRAKYAARKWLLRDGDDASPADAAKRPGWLCTARTCQANVNDKKVVYLQQEPADLADCSGADIVIASFPLRGGCRGAQVRIDRFDVWRHGAYAIYLDADAPKVVTVANQRGDRPWTIKPIARRKIRLVPDTPD